VASDGVARPSVSDLDRTCLDQVGSSGPRTTGLGRPCRPTTNYGKVVKRELRDRLRAETADGGSR
jgi:long-chain acyl-CoA synthetase